MDIATILTRKYPGKEWTLNGDSYSGLQWLSDSTKPTKKHLESLRAEVEAEIEAEKQAEIDARNSAIEKLAALGLSVDEIRAAFGLK